MKKVTIHVGLNMDLYNKAVARRLNFSEEFSKAIILKLSEADLISQSKVELQQAKLNDAVAKVAESLRESRGQLSENALKRAEFWEDILLKKYGVDKSRFELLDAARKLIK